MPVSTYRMLAGAVDPVGVLSAVDPVAVPCVTAMGIPAMLIVADRELVPVFAGTV